MQLIYWICIFMCLVSPFSAQDCQRIEDDGVKFKSFVKMEEFCIEVENGFNILFEVESVETSTGTLDHLMIKQGRHLEDDGTGLIFAHKLNNPKSFLIFSSVAYVKFDVDSQHFPRRASINFRRVGKAIITTTESPVTQNPWPQPSGNDSIYYTVHVSGHNYTTYKDKKIQLAFRESVAKMAQQYVQINNFPITKDITEKNVLVSDLKMCDLVLPESTSCAVISFALPIIMDEAKYPGYELKESHLSLMWTRYSDDYLAENNFTNYQVPDLESATIAWSTAVAIVIILLLVCIVVGMIVHPKIAAKIRQKNRGDSSSNIHLTYNKTRNISDTSLSPHNLQVPPAMFRDNDDDVEDTWVMNNS